jgi:hypothetical protein
MPLPVVQAVPTMIIMCLVDTPIVLIDFYWLKRDSLDCLVAAEYPHLQGFFWEQGVIVPPHAQFTGGPYLHL